MEFVLGLKLFFAEEGLGLSGTASTGGFWLLLVWLATFAAICGKYSVATTCSNEKKVKVNKNIFIITFLNNPSVQATKIKSKIEIL